MCNIYREMVVKIIFCNMNFFLLFENVFYFLFLIVFDIFENELRNRYFDLLQGLMNILEFYVVDVNLVFADSQIFESLFKFIIFGEFFKIVYFFVMVVFERLKDIFKK